MKNSVFFPDLVAREGAFSLIRLVNGDAGGGDNSLRARGREAGLRMLAVDCVKKRVVEKNRLCWVGNTEHGAGGKGDE
jgi:hypothetical protein